MRFAILGPLRVHDGDSEIGISAPKQRALLAGLLVAAGRTQDADLLIDVVWGDRAPSGSRDALQMQMVRLRQTVGDRIARRIVSRPGGYLVEVEPDELDLSRFTGLLERGRRAVHEGNWEHGLTLLRDSLDLWSGRPLQDVPSERLQLEMAHMEEMRLVALELSLDARLNLGHDGELVGELRMLVGQHPLRERFAAQLMTALHQSGRQADALVIYREARDRLDAELGVEPGAELRTLHRHILENSDAGDLRQTAALPDPAQLPADVGDFAGRAAPLAVLAELMTAADPHSGVAVAVIAITGAGGMGKTALAVHAGHLHRGLFPDGQLYVNLRGGSDHPVPGADVLRRFLCALGVSAPQVPADADERAVLYRSLLAGKRVLIVLDDARDSAQVRPLIPAGSGNVVLITSRSRLTGLDSMRRIQLGAMGRDSSWRLLAQVAGVARIQADPDASARVLAACAGLPLALRIVAAHLAAEPTRTVSELADRLADSRRRLDVLRADDRAVRASFAISYNDLPDGERPPARLFRLLGLWDGPAVSRPAAAALAGLPETVVSELIESLTEHHLLEPAPSSRYQFHDLVRSYAMERCVAEEPAVVRDLALRRVFSWYLHSAHGASRLIEPQRYLSVVSGEPDVPPLTLESREDAVSWYESERGNLMSAVSQLARLGLDDCAWRLAVTLVPYYNLRKVWDDWIATHQLALASARRAADGYGVACVLCGLGRAWTDLHRFDDALAAYQQSLTLFREAGDERGALRVLSNLASLHGARGELESSLLFAREALAIARKSADERSEGVILGTIGVAFGSLGRYRDAVHHFRLALAIRQRSDDLYGQGIILTNLGEAYQGLEDYEQADYHYRLALDIRRAISDRFGEASTLSKLGQLRRKCDDRDGAYGHLSAALRIFEELKAPDAASVLSRLNEL